MFIRAGLVNHLCPYRDCGPAAAATAPSPLSQAASITDRSLVHAAVVPRGHRQLCESAGLVTAPFLVPAAHRQLCESLAHAPVVPERSPSVVRIPAAPPSSQASTVGCQNPRSCPRPRPSRAATVSCANLRPTPPLSRAAETSKRPPPLLLPSLALPCLPSPALKYSVMIPKPCVPQGKRRRERLRNRHSCHEGESPPGCLKDNQLPCNDRE
jgi:hypothetical protein